MKKLLFLVSVAVLFLSVSCSEDSQEPLLQCGMPSTDNYIVGQIDTACAFVESNEKWFNFPETVSRFDCGRLLKSVFINYEEDISFTVLLSIPHTVGNDCQSLSPDAIQIGKYEFLKGTDISEPGKAGFSVTFDRQIFASWSSDLTQGDEAYIEVTSVEDVPPSPSWSYATQFKRVKGKVSCSLKLLNSNEDPIKVENLEFSMYMIY